MAVLNITYNGLSADYPLDVDVKLSDADVRRIAIEVVRAGGVRGLQIANLPDNAFDVVVERVVRQVRDLETAHTTRTHDLDRDAAHVGIRQLHVDVERVVRRQTVVGDVQNRHYLFSLLSLSIP